MIRSLPKVGNQFEYYYMAVQGILNDFLKFYLPKYYEGKVKDTENRVAELIDETEDLKKEIDKDSSKIEELKKEITRMEADLNAKNELLKVRHEKLIQRKEKMERIRTNLREF